MAQPSAIGMAFNHVGKSTRDDHRDNLTVVSTDLKRAMLLTPPTSISPNLPPSHQDLDLDARGHALTAEALDSLSELDSAGSINPAMLANHHLPEILVNHGPLAIRHIMSYLNSSVPGFSRISAAKARRIIVAALESRVEEANVPPGEIVFEKVGWGRWDARRGEPRAALTPPASLPTGYGSGFVNHAHANLGSSFTASGPYSEDDHDMYENEADKMSLDGDEGYQSSEPPPDPMMEFDDVETDEEDWESMGADALRARSLPPGSLPRVPAGSGRIYQPIYTYKYRPTHMAQSVPAKAIPIKQHTNAQERAAAEALLNLGSM